MKPTLVSGDAVRARPVIFPPNRGDIVILEDIEGADCAIKRVVGMPGETIGFFHGHVYINRQLVKEPYVSQVCTYMPDSAPPFEDFQEGTLGPDEYYVLWDNRLVSADSRFYGPVSIDRLKKVVISLTVDSKLAFTQRYLVRTEHGLEVLNRPAPAPISRQHYPNQFVAQMN